MVLSRALYRDVFLERITEELQVHKPFIGPQDQVDVIRIVDPKLIEAGLQIQLAQIEIAIGMDPSLCNKLEVTSDGRQQVDRIRSVWHGLENTTNTLCMAHCHERE